MVHNQRFLAVVVASIFAPSLSFAAFNLPLTSARATAMGHASLAASGEAANLFSNPAGLSSMRATEVSFLYGKPYAGLSDVNLGMGYAALGVPTSLGTLGLGYAHFQAQGLMTEQTLALSYGVNLHKLQLGLTAKRLSHSFHPGGDELAQNDPVFANGTSKSALAFDVGGTLPMGRFLKAGATVRNLNNPNVGLAGEDKVAREVQGGLLLDFAGAGFKVAGDLMLRSRDAEGIKEEPIPFLGIEKSFSRQNLALRAGANTLEYTGGFGLKLGSVSFDYALVFAKNLMSDNAGSHQLGMTYQFGKGK